MKNKMMGLMVMFLLTSTVYGQNMNLKTGQKAFDAWQIGERTGKYDDFKKLLSKNFNVFSHPLIGKYSGAEALVKMQNLIGEREKLSNALTFTDVKTFSDDTKVIFQFNSQGTVQNGKFPYQGFNIIIFHIQNDEIVGFQEYFGFIDPNWFKG
jgi:hypothetical protein